MAIDVGVFGLQTTPTAGSLWPSSTAGQKAAAWDASLAAKTGYAERAMASAYGKAFLQAEKQLDDLMKRIQSETAKGNFSPSWQMQQDRLKYLMNQYSDAIKTFQNSALSNVNAVHQAGVQAALNHTKTEIRDYMGGTAPTGITLPDFGPETWGTLNKAAFAQAMGYLNEIDAPLRALMEKLGADTLHAVQGEFAKGFALGYNPKKIAQNIKNATANIALGRARTIARTEFHRAYRETKREQFSGSDVLQGWVWKANLDGGTCGLCVAMAGSVHPKDDYLDSHPNCRCSMVPLTKTWDQLGFPGVPGDRPLAMNTPSGPMWLATQSPDTIHRVLGKARGDDFMQRRFNGEHPTTIARSYVRQTYSPAWGPMKQLAPFTGKGKMPTGAPPAPVPVTPKPAPSYKPPSVQKAATPKPPAAPKPAPLPKPVAQAMSKVQGMFDRAVKPAKAASTTVGKKWLNARTSYAGVAKGNIAEELAKRSRADLDKALRNWDGEWAARQGHMIPTMGGYSYSYALSKPWKDMTVAERDAFLAGAEGDLLRQNIVSNIIQTWAGTSADNSPLSLLAQQRAEAIFGLQAQTAHLSRSRNTGWIDAQNAPKPIVDIMDSTLRSMYQHTQEEFAAAGIKSIKLVRGQSWSDGRPYWVDSPPMSYLETREGMTMIQPMSSFSSSKAVAKRFLGGSSNSYYITAEFPVEWIVGTARTGFGCLSEQEFVVLSGRPMHVTVQKATRW